jgi:DNA-binding response OmpR family regulator
VAKKILIVDDEEDIVMVLRARFEEKGYEVSEAADGKEALNSVKESVPDIIILDEMMPKISGFKVCGMLKADARYSKIPIIIHTARVAHEEDLAISKEVGANDLVSKAIDFEDLLKKVEEFTS